MKKFISLMLVIISVVSLAACDGKNDTETPESTEAAASDACTSAIETTSENTTADGTTAGGTTADETTATDTTTAAGTTASDTTTSADTTTAKDTTTVADTTAADSSADTSADPEPTSVLTELLKTSDDNILKTVRPWLEKYDECLPWADHGIIEEGLYWAYFESEEAYEKVEATVPTELEYLSSSKGLYEENDPPTAEWYCGNYLFFVLITNYSSVDDIRAHYSQWIADEECLDNIVADVSGYTVVYNGNFYFCWGGKGGISSISHDFDTAKITEKGNDYFKVQFDCTYEDDDFYCEEIHTLTFGERDGKIVITDCPLCECEAPV